jgi:hypothetical protein
VLTKGNLSLVSGLLNSILTVLVNLYVSQYGSFPTVPLPPPPSPPAWVAWIPDSISTHLVCHVVVAVSDIEEWTGDQLQVLMKCVGHSSHTLIAM